MTRPRRRDERSPWFSFSRTLTLVVAVAFASVVVAKVRDKLADARRGAVRRDLRLLEEAASRYAITHQGYPEDLDFLNFCCFDCSRGCYRSFEPPPKDPWGREYVYRPPSRRGEKPLVFTLGKDGMTGGDGEDRDLSNLDLHDGRF